MQISPTEGRRDGYFQATDFQFVEKGAHDLIIIGKDEIISPLSICKSIVIAYDPYSCAKME